MLLKLRYFIFAIASNQYDELSSHVRKEGAKGKGMLQAVRQKPKIDRWV